MRPHEFVLTSWIFDGALTEAGVGWCGFDGGGGLADGGEAVDEAGAEGDADGLVSHGGDEVGEFVGVGLQIVEMGLELDGGVGAGLVGVGGGDGVFPAWGARGAAGG